MRRDRRPDWLVLVQTACIITETVRTHAGSTESAGVTVLANAMRVDVRSVPGDMAVAAWEFVDWHYAGKEQPAWVRYN
jgi:hypothetical protein